jgi:hypothetical protein
MSSRDASAHVFFEPIVLVAGRHSTACHHVIRDAPGPPARDRSNAPTVTGGATAVTAAGLARLWAAMFVVR